MNPLFKFSPNFNEPAYYKICPILHANEKLRFKYYEYSTQMRFDEQLNGVRTALYHALIFLLKGEIHINWDEYKDITIKAGEMFFLPRGAKVSGYIVDDVNVVIAVIDRNMTNKELQDIKLMKTYEKFDKYEYKPMLMNQQMIRLAESVKDYLVNGVDCSCLHEAKFKELYVILHWCYSLADNAQLFYPMTKAISPFRDFILENFKVTDSIDDLVKKANMSRSTFDRKFKDAFETTPLKWIEQQIKHAIINKASEPNVTVKDIMYEVGIYNSSQFTNLCKRICGVTPSQLIRTK